jgi:hypothetical protein
LPKGYALKGYALSGESGALVDFEGVLSRRLASAVEMMMMMNTNIISDFRGIDFEIINLTGLILRSYSWAALLHDSYSSSAIYFNRLNKIDFCLVQRKEDGRSSNDALFLQKNSIPLSLWQPQAWPFAMSDLIAFCGAKAVR